MEPFIQSLVKWFSEVHLSGRDVVDILLVAFILYQFVQILRGTLGAKMALGLAVLMVVSYISDRAELSTTYWLFGNFWQIWVIALIILFQPEFRQALAMVGQQSGFLGRPQIGQQAARRTVEEIVKAVSILAESKIGAIIVLEREMGLRTFREMGVEVDGKVSNELLRCIFFPDNPLHDGAVIISGDRVVAAACFLPLTKNPLVPSTMGSRHRAAMGITEETDAAAIVVSEESGIISVALGGKMTRELYSSHLKQVLETIYGLSPSSRSEAQAKTSGSSRSSFGVRLASRKHLSTPESTASLVDTRPIRPIRKAARTPEPAPSQETPASGAEESRSTERAQSAP